MLPKERRIFVAASTVRLEEAFWSSNQQICSRTMGKSNTLDTEIGCDDHIKSCKLHSCLNLVRRQFYLNQWWGVGISTFPAVRSRSWVANSRWPHGDVSTTTICDTKLSHILNSAYLWLIQFPILLRIQFGKVKGLSDHCP